MAANGKITISKGLAEVSSGGFGVAESGMVWMVWSRFGSAGPAFVCYDRGYRGYRGSSTDQRRISFTHVMTMAMVSFQYFVLVCCVLGVRGDRSLVKK